MSLIPIVWAGAPRSWAAGRSRDIQYVVMHDTEGHEGPLDAENGVAYDKRRTDGTSTHIFVDTNSALREVRDVDTAYAARAKGNALGIQIEMCHAGPWDLSEPNDAATFDNAAQVAAQLCLAHHLPARHLSVGQVRAAWYDVPSVRPKGICGHRDVTLAYPEDDGTHTDPGTTFPWVEFIARVQHYMTPEAPAGAGGGETIMRYTFDASWPDRPADLGDRIVNTDRLGVYHVEPFSAPQGGAPAVTVLKKADVAGGKWDFAATFSAVTGGCTYGAGMADWRAGDGFTDAQVSALAEAIASRLPAGGLTIADVTTGVRAAFAHGLGG